MAKVTSGGQSKTDFFAVKYDSTAGTYEIYAIPAGTEVTGPTSADAFSLDEITSSKPQFQDDGTVTMEWDQMDSGKDLDAFLDMVAVPSSESAGLPEYTLESGVTKGGSSGSSGYQVIAISYLQSDSDAGEVKVIIALGGVAASSGSYETTADDYNKVSMSVEGSKSEAAVTVPLGLFDTNIVSAPASDMEIPKGKCFIRDWLTAAA